MSLHTLKTSNVRQARKRVGRGNGNNWGRTCGRGEKGQKSRSGSTIRPHFEGGQIPLFRRLPKRGFKSRNTKVFAIVNIRDLDMTFADGDSVTVESCQAKTLVSKLGAGLKILGDGQLTKKLTVTAAAFSESAQQKIEAAGGSCTVGQPEETATAAEA
ncbi:50S ribosomal protein L15 [bacterium F16]|nr:50S ribosomal protein L15 [bacterium F16]